MKYLPALAAALLLGGCVKASRIAFDEGQREAKPEAYAVEIIEARAVSRAFRVIGIVEVKVNGDTSKRGAILAMKREARQMGADALMDFERQPAGGAYMFGGYRNTIEKWSAKAIIWE